MNLVAVQTMTPQVLGVVQVSGANTETVAYTVPTSSSLKVSTGSLCNTTGAAVTVSLSIVPSGGVAGVSNRVISGYSLAAGDTLPLSGYLSGALMGAGDFISLNFSATGVTMVLTGVVSA